MKRTCVEISARRDLLTSSRRLKKRKISLLLIAAAFCWSAIGFSGADSLSASEPSGPAANAIHLYYFTSKGCAPCQLVKPAIAKLSDEGYPVTTIDVGERPDWAQSFRVSVTPTVAMVQGNQVIGHHAGAIKLEKLRTWFDSVGYRPGTTESATSARLVETRPEQAKVVLSKSAPSALASRAFSTPTMINGTRTPKNSREASALAATVRLSVEDPQGTSYATGTVIHVHEGESLVMTCGHVFRDSQGTGKISAEFGFENGKTTVVPGELIAYDSDARDIALVVINHGPAKLAAVPVASISNAIDRGDFVFSLGCDHGELPTIRRTKIKNRATYDGAIKYDIFGRPVDGRSGGGLFNAQGELIGVCNAAAVEVDEGIYTALDTVHWQLAVVNLSHLFDQPGQSILPASRNHGPAARVAAIAKQNPAQGESIGLVSANEVWKNVGEASAPASRPASIEPRRDAFTSSDNLRLARDSRGSQIQNVGLQREVQTDEKEVIILVRSKSGSQETKTITISQPTKKLLRYLDKVGNAGSQKRQIDVARYREIRRPDGYRR